MNKFLFYYSNLHIGAGPLGGSYAGLERDEQGNINGFSPEKFLAGFIAGGMSSKATQMALKSPKLRQKALDFSTQAGEIITRTLQESHLPRHAQNALESMLGKNLSKMLDSRAWINDPAQTAKNFKNTAQNLLDKEAKGKSDIMPKSKQDKATTMKLDKFLDSKGKMSEDTLRKYAINIPPLKFNSPNQFKTLFTEIKGKFGIVKTPYKDMQVDIVNAYRHFYINTKNVNRNYFKSAFFETFRDPLFIAKDNSKGKESIYFYKPFLDKDKNFISLFGIGIDKEGKIQYKTIYDDKDRNRFKQMTRIADENIVYVKE